MYYFSYLYSGAQADDELSCQMIDRLKIDTAGNDTAGNDTAGNDTAGNETAGNETAGNDTAGNETAGNETRMDVRSGGCDMIWNWSLIGGCEVASFPGSTTSECKFWRGEPGIFSHVSMT